MTKKEFLWLEKEIENFLTEKEPLPVVKIVTKTLRGVEVSRTLNAIEEQLKNLKDQILVWWSFLQTADIPLSKKRKKDVLVGITLSLIYSLKKGGDDGKF